VVHSKLVVRSDTAIWYADPVSNQVLKILDARGHALDRIFVEALANRQFTLHWLDH
jgi:hypothetical protein